VLCWRIFCLSLYFFLFVVFGLTKFDIFQHGCGDVGHGVVGVGSSANEVHQRKTINSIQFQLVF
jgi:hypothetical protein